MLFGFQPLSARLRLSLLLAVVLLGGCDSGTDEPEPETPLPVNLNGAWDGSVEFNHSAVGRSQQIRYTYDLAQNYALQINGSGLSLVVTELGVVYRMPTFNNGFFIGDTTNLDHSYTFHGNVEVEGNTATISLFKINFNDPEPPFASESFRIQDGSLTATTLISVLNYDNSETGSGAYNSLRLDRRQAP